MADPIETGMTRVFFMEGGAGPDVAPVYEGLWRATSLTWDQGDPTPIYIPDPDKYSAYKIVKKIPGEQSSPQITVQARYTPDRSTFLRLVRFGCEHTLQVHIGSCQNPRDFNAGWDKVVVIENARLGNYSTDDIGALEPGQAAAVNEEVPFIGDVLYEVVKISFAEKAATNIINEVIGVVICDVASCGGDCGAATSGCDIIFAVTKQLAASPGLPAEVVFSDDGGATWLDTSIDSLPVNQDPSDIACVGDYLVVVSNGDGAIHYALKADVLAGTDAWTKVTTGIVGAPNKIYTASPVHTWIVGDSGYVYFTEDPTSGVTVQDAGSATAENLLDIQGIDELSILAVGANNAVIYTTNGGITWSSVTGPAPAVDLNACWMFTRTKWMVGTAGGNLYYTTDSGATWVAKAFPGSGSGSIEDIKFSTPSVGWMAHTTTAPAGRILRTINGGNSWYVAPESVGAIPTNTAINALAICVDANVIYAGGLKAGGDGILIAGA